MKQANETAALLAQDWSQVDTKNLGSLLAHDDYRVRLEAQLELVSREEYTVLAQAIEESENNLAQLHGLWGIGILARHGIFEIKFALRKI